ncbi:Uncharacterised protein [Mycobacterium tuberculosis]|nr:Uncharacterised protein [Mycobacterium tuberculosis]
MTMSKKKVQTIRTPIRPALLILGQRDFALRMTQQPRIVHSRTPYE